MKPLLVIKAANGYVVVPFEGTLPQADLSALNRGKSVGDILAAHFEPPQADAAKEAA